MTNSWKDLPAEVLHLILSYLLEGRYNETVAECALVCKSWGIVVKSQLYGKVSIYSITGLSNFNNTIVENADTANMVKSVELRMGFDKNFLEQCGHVHTLLSNLPNLQHFSSRPPCFLWVIAVLLDSKLKNLISFGDHNSIPFSNDYVTCALLLRKRLQDVSLRGAGEPYNRLYKKLHRFKKLEELTYETRLTYPFEELDSVVEKCLVLRKLTIIVTHMQIRSLSDQTAAVAEKRIPLLQYSPRPAVQYLEIVRDYGKVDQSLLTYIIHKFPSLKRLVIDTAGVHIKDASTFKCLISYLSKIDSVYIHKIHTDIRWICDGVGSYWEAKCSYQPHTAIKLRITFNPDITDAILKFRTNKITTFEVPLSGYNFQDIDLLVNYGGYVGVLVIYDVNAESMFGKEKVVKLLENCIASINFCAKLNKLSFHMCDLIRRNMNTKFKPTCLQELAFRRCCIGSRVLDAIFSDIHHINALTLEECIYVDEHDKETALISVDLPSATIGCVSVILSDSSKYVFVLIVRTFLKTYYKYDFEANGDGYLKISSESEYKDEEYVQSIHLRIGCLSITSLDVSCAGHTARLS